MSCDSTSLGVVDLQRDLGSDLHTFDVEEAIFVSKVKLGKRYINSLDVMRRYVEDSEEQHGVGDLSMEPLRLIKRQYAHLGTEPSEDISAHWHDDHHGVD